MMRQIFTLLLAAAFLELPELCAGEESANRNKSLHSGEVKNVAFLPHLDLMVTQSQVDSECEVIVWKASTGHSLLAKSVEFEAGQVFLTKDGSEVLLIPEKNERTNRIRRWHIESGKEIESLELPEPLEDASLDTSPDGKYLSIHSGKKLTIWQLSEAKVVFSREFDTAYRSIAYGPDSRFLLACGQHGVDKLSLPKGNVDFTYKAEGLTGAQDLCVTPDKKGFVACCVFGGYWRIVHWNLDSAVPFKVGGEIQGDYISRKFKNPTFSTDGTDVAVIGFFGRDSLAWGVRFSFPGLEEQDLRFRHKSDSLLQAGFDIGSKHFIAVSASLISHLNLETGETEKQYPLSKKGKAWLK